MSARITTFVSEQSIDAAALDLLFAEARTREAGSRIGRPTSSRGSRSTAARCRVRI
jgi:hypothetical protein